MLLARPSRRPAVFSYQRDEADGRDVAPFQLAAAPRQDREHLLVPSPERDQEASPFGELVAHRLRNLRRGLQDPQQYAERFRVYDFDVEIKHTMQAKIKRFEWGLLQGMLERN